MNKILKLIRWNDWYDSKLPFLFLTYYYLIIINNEVNMQSLILLFPLSILFIALMSFGYMLNDYFDKSIDNNSGKENALSSLTELNQIIILIIVLFIGLIAFIPFYQYKFSFVFLFFYYLSSFIYSAYPFRLKEKGVWGLVFASLGQRIFPILIVFTVFEYFQFETLIFLILSFFIGLRWILVHQVLDYENDKKTSVETFVVNETPLRIYNLMLYVFAFEVIIAAIFVGIIYAAIPNILYLLIAYLLYELYLYPFWKQLGFKRMLLSYDFAPLADFYSLWIPLGLSFFLSYLNPLYFIVVLVEILWKIRYVKFDLGLIKLKRLYHESK